MGVQAAKTTSRSRGPADVLRVAFRVALSGEVWCTETDTLPSLAICRTGALARAARASAAAGSGVGALAGSSTGVGGSTRAGSNSGGVLLATDADQHTVHLLGERQRVAGLAEQLGELGVEGVTDRREELAGGFFLPPLDLGEVAQADVGGGGDLAQGAMLPLPACAQCVADHPT